MAISLLCLIYVAIKGMQAWQSIGSELTLTVALARIGIALLPMLLGYVAAALAWVALARGLGAPLPRIAGTGIYLTTQIAKYLPGNVGHYAGRIVLSMQRGCPAAIVALSMTLEIALVVLIAALFSLPMLRMVLGPLHALSGIAIAGVVTALVLLAAMMGVAALAKPRWSASVRDSIAKLAAVISRRTALPGLALAAFLLAMSIALSSLSLLTLGETPTYLRVADLAAMVSLYSVAWIAGVLTLGAPAGIGVREAILVQGLSPLLGATEAVTTALLFRLLTTLADAIVFGIGTLLLRFAADARSAREHDGARS